MRLNLQTSSEVSLFSATRTMMAIFFMTTKADFEGILLKREGSNQLHVTVYDGTVYFTMSNSSLETNLLFTADKKDCETIKKFIDSKEVIHNPINILEKQNLLP